MFLVLLLVLLLVAPSATNNLFWLAWVSFNPVLAAFQLFLLFSSAKLLYSKGIYESILWGFLSVLALTVGLFVHQLDVFACFLLVSETVVIFFILTFVIHVNHTNLVLRGKRQLPLLSLILLSALFINFFGSGATSYYVP